MKHVMSNYYSADNRCTEWVKSRKEPCGAPGHFTDQTGAVACGRHKATLANPVRLPIDMGEVEKAARANRRNGVAGDVALGKILTYWTAVEYMAGHLPVFPNDSRRPGGSEGLWLPELSPKRLGPVLHDELGAPPALTIEVYHQATRVFSHEADESGNPLPEWYEFRNRMFTDPVLAKRRHKYADSKPEHKAHLEKVGAEPVNGKEPQDTPNPLYSLHIGPDGTEYRTSYVESRQFYCRWYEKLVVEQDDYWNLREMIESGMNLTLWSYDAPRIWDPTITAEEAYLDARYAYGHENVLRAMLTLSPEDYPWRKYATYPFPF